MRIVTVEYRRLQSNNYDNETVGATATVDSTETPGQALEQLRDWVRDHLTHAEPPSGWPRAGTITASGPFSVPGPPSSNIWQRLRGWVDRQSRKADSDLPF